MTPWVITRVTYVCVGREPPKGAVLYRRCNGGWEVDYALFNPLALAYAPENFPRCPRCGERETVQVRALVRVIEVAA